MSRNVSTLNQSALLNSYKLTLDGSVVQLGVPKKLTAIDENAAKIEIQLSEQVFSRPISLKKFYEELDKAYKDELERDSLYFWQTSVFKKLQDKSVLDRIAGLVEHANKVPDGQVAKAFFRVVKNALVASNNDRIFGVKGNRPAVDIFDTTAPNKLVASIPKQKESGFFVWLTGFQSNLRYEIKKHFDWVVAQLNHEASTLFLKNIDFGKDTIEEKLKGAEVILESIQKKRTALSNYLKTQKLSFAWTGEREKTNQLIQALETKLESYDDVVRGVRDNMAKNIQRQVSNNTRTVDVKSSATVVEAPAQNVVAAAVRDSVAVNKAVSSYVDSRANSTTATNNASSVSTVASPAESPEPVRVASQKKEGSALAESVEVILNRSNTRTGKEAVERKPGDELLLGSLFAKHYAYCPSGSNSPVSEEQVRPVVAEYLTESARADKENFHPR